jgi:hypothetical protein
MTTGVSAAPIDNVNNAPEKEKERDIVRGGRVRTGEIGRIKRVRGGVGVRIRERIGEQDDVNKRKREVK